MMIPVFMIIFHVLSFQYQKHQKARIQSYYFAILMHSNDGMIMKFLPFRAPLEFLGFEYLFNISNCGSILGLGFAT